MKKAIRVFLLVLGLTFIAVLMLHSCKEIQDLLREMNLVFFILSILVAFIGDIIYSIFFRELLAKYGCRVDIRLASKLYLYGQIAKYIPGKIWGIVFQKTFLNKPGTMSALLFSNIDLMVVLMITSLAIAISIVLFNINLPLSFIIFIVGFIACLAVSKSYWIARLINIVTAKIKLSEADLFICKNNPSITMVVFCYVATWFFYLLAWFLMLFATFGFSIEESSLYIAYLTLAWIAGVLAFFVPAGMGIREGIFILLSRHIGVNSSIEILAAVAVLIRFWLILQELGGAGIIFLWNINKNTPV